MRYDNRTRKLTGHGGQRRQDFGRRPGRPQRRTQKERSTMKIPSSALIAAIAAPASPVPWLPWRPTPQRHARPGQGRPRHAVILSDTLHYDDVNKTSTFTGNVILTRGAMTLRGDKLVTREDAQGNQFGTATADKGRVVTIRQENPEKFETIIATGLQADYAGSSERHHPDGPGHRDPPDLRPGLRQHPRRPDHLPRKIRHLRGLRRPKTRPPPAGASGPWPSPTPASTRRSPGARPRKRAGRNAHDHTRRHLHPERRRPRVRQPPGHRPRQDLRHAAPSSRTFPCRWTAARSSACSAPTAPARPPAST